MIASRVGQLKQRRVPADILILTAGRAKVVLVKIREVGEPAPEESWLRAHAALISERRHEAACVSVLVPRSGDRFSWSEVSSDGGPRRPLPPCHPLHPHRSRRLLGQLQIAATEVPRHPARRQLDFGCKGSCGRVSIDGHRVHCFANPPPGRASHRRFPRRPSLAKLPAKCRRGP